MTEAAAIDAGDKFVFRPAAGLTFSSQFIELLDARHFITCGSVSIEGKNYRMKKRIEPA